jgi:hypothetical protein
MKSYLVAYSIICSFVNGYSQESVKNHTQFIPYSVGNYWVYESDNDSNKIDTVKITGVKIINGDTAYQFNNRGYMRERNDTICSYQSQWSSGLFPCLEFFPSEKETQFRIMIGGDVSRGRTVIKINGSYLVNGKEYFNCYKFSQLLEGPIDIIISYGIGIIATEHNFFNIYTKEYTLHEKLLIDYKIQ